MVPVFREDCSEDWKRIVHKVDLSRIVRHTISRKLIRDGWNGLSNIRWHPIRRSFLLFFILGPTPIMIPFYVGYSSNAKNKQIFTSNDLILLLHLKEDLSNLSRYLLGKDWLRNLKILKMSTCFLVMMSQNNLFRIRKRLLLEQECILEKYLVRMSWLASSKNYQKTIRKQSYSDKNLFFTYFRFSTLMEWLEGTTE